MIGALYQLNVGILWLFKFLGELYNHNELRLIKGNVGHSFSH